MQTLSVFALKGGVGKSAITVFLADFLSSVFDQRVLVVDLDPQLSYSVEALNALDDTLRDSFKTIDKKYGGAAKPFTPRSGAYQGKSWNA
jgi:cellulose biosynthesis protein BcsQ